jgi:F-type H+-transporting ATPase subunit b
MQALLAASNANPLQPDYVTMGVTLVVFVALLAILYKFAWGPILAGLKKREDAIFAARDAARKAQHDAEETRIKLKAEFDAAHERIRAMMDEARKDADALRAEQKELGVKEAQGERERAKREIESAKDQALQEIQQQAVKLAALIGAKAIGRSVTIDDQQRLIAESLTELQSAVKA